MADKDKDKVFSNYDKNNDGTIDKSEVAAALGELGLDPSDSFVQQVIKRCDDDAGGTIDKEEFKNLAEALEEVKGLKQMFHDMDKSGEGQLSVQELIDASTKFYKEKFSEEKAKSMVEFADVDKDGTLSVDEFLQIMFKDRDDLGK